MPFPCDLDEVVELTLFHFLTVEVVGVAGGLHKAEV